MQDRRFGLRGVCCIELIGASMTIRAYMRGASSSVLRFPLWFGRVVVAFVVSCSRGCLESDRHKPPQSGFWRAKV